VVSLEHTVETDAQLKRRVAKLERRVSMLTVVLRLVLVRNRSTDVLYRDGVARCESRRVSKRTQGQHGREYWTNLVAEFEAAGLSQRAFCERNYWLYALRKEAQKEPESAKRFVQVIPAKTTFEPSARTCTVRMGSVELAFSGFAKSLLVTANCAF
jgi:hypothetical protein